MSIQSVNDLAKCVRAECRRSLEVAIGRHGKGNRFEPPEGHPLRRFRLKHADYRDDLYPISLELEADSIVMVATPSPGDPDSSYNCRIVVDDLPMEQQIDLVAMAWPSFGSAPKHWQFGDTGYGSHMALESMEGFVAFTLKSRLRPGEGVTDPDGRQYDIEVTVKLTPMDVQKA